MRGSARRRLRRQPSSAGSPANNGRRDRRRRRSSEALEPGARATRWSLTVRRSHRRGRARLGPGRHASTPRADGCRPGTAAALDQRRCAGRRSSVREVERGGAGLRRPVLAPRWRRYRYTILNTPSRPIRSWPDRRLARDPRPRLRAMAARPRSDFVGEHDFSSFCRRPPTEPRPTAGDRSCGP